MHNNRVMPQTWTKSMLMGSGNSRSASFYSREQRGFRSSNVLNNSNYYQALNVTKAATQDEVKKAYFKLAKQYHPDVNKAPEAKEKFATINEAYETLGDDAKRRVYDQTGMNSDEQQ